MELSKEVIKDFEDFKATGKTPIAMIYDSLQHSVAVNDVISRFQTLANPELIGNIKSVKGWNNMNALEPNVIRTDVLKYNSEGYSSYALKEYTDRVNAVRLPLTSSYSTNKLLFAEGKTNEKCIGIMRLLASAYKISIEVGETRKATAVNTKGDIFYQVKHGVGIGKENVNARIIFNKVITSEYKTIALSDAEKMIKVLDLVCRVLITNELKKQDVKTDDVTEKIIKHCSSLLVMINFFAGINLGEDKVAVYSALSLQLCNGLALLGDLELAHVAKISQEVNEKLCTKFNLKPRDYIYANRIAQLEEYVQQEQLKAPQAEQKAIVKVADKQLKPASLKKMLNKIMEGTIMKQALALQKSCWKEASKKTHDKYLKYYAFYEQMLADFVIGKDQEVVYASPYIESNCEEKVIAHNSAIDLMDLRDKILHDIAHGKVDIKNIAGSVSALNKYANETFGTTMKQYIKNQIKHAKDNLPNEKVAKKEHAEEM